MSKRTFFWLFGLGVLFQGMAKAQTPQRLTLEDALQIAEGDNPVFRQARNTASLNGIEMRTTWLDQILPRADLSLFDTQFTGNLQRRATDNFGNPIENPSADWVYFSRTTQALNLSWDIQGQSLFQDHRRQSLVNQGRDLDRLRALTDLQVEVQRLYADALEQQDLLRAEEELLEARRIDLEVVERLFSLALRSRVDVLNAELAVEQQSLGLRQQAAASENALLALRTALGAESDISIELADEPLPIFDPSELQSDGLVRQALEVNPTLRRSTMAVRTASLEAAAQRNRWWPEVTAGVTVFRRAQAERSGALFDIDPQGGLESLFYVELSLPVFNDFFRNRQEAERRTVELDNQREADREARLATERSVRSAVLDLSNQWESVRLAQRSLEIAEEALRLAREEYRIGTRSFEELRLSFDLEADVRRQVITARHAFVDALLDLEAAVGAPIRPAAIPQADSAGGR